MELASTSKEEEECAAFEEKVKRTVFIDNLSPMATESVLKAAFNQFGNVTNVHIFPDYVEPKYPAKSALVEMKTANQAEAIISEVTNSPFMISGMPRPIRAFSAQIEMFDDRPRKSSRKIHCRWVDPTDPEFEMAKKMKALAHKRAAEKDFLIERQVEDERELDKKQRAILKANYKKYVLIEGISGNGPNGDVKKLGRHYGFQD